MGSGTFKSSAQGKVSTFPFKQYRDTFTAVSKAQQEQVGQAASQQPSERCQLKKRNVGEEQGTHE